MTFRLLDMIWKSGSLWINVCGVRGNAESRLSSRLTWALNGKGELRGPRIDIYVQRIVLQIYRTYYGTERPRLLYSATKKCPWTVFNGSRLRMMRRPSNLSDCHPGVSSSDINTSRHQEAILMFGSYFKYVITQIICSTGAWRGCSSQGDCSVLRNLWCKSWSLITPQPKGRSIGKMVTSGAAETV